MSGLWASTSIARVANMAASDRNPYSGQNPRLCAGRVAVAKTAILFEPTASSAKADRLLSRTPLSTSLSPTPLSCLYCSPSESQWRTSRQGLSTRRTSQGRVSTSAKGSLVPLSRPSRPHGFPRRLQPRNRMPHHPYKVPASLSLKPNSSVAYITSLGKLLPAASYSTHTEHKTTYIFQLSTCLAQEQNCHHVVGE